MQYSPKLDHDSDGPSLCVLRAVEGDMVYLDRVFAKFPI